VLYQPSRSAHAAAHKPAAASSSFMATAAAAECASPTRQLLAAVRQLLQRSGRRPIARGSNLDPSPRGNLFSGAVCVTA
jgi:hypothetical protein